MTVLSFIILKTHRYSLKLSNFKKIYVKTAFQFNFPTHSHPSEHQGIITQPYPYLHYEHCIIAAIGMQQKNQETITQTASLLHKRGRGAVTQAARGRGGEGGG